MSDSTTPYTEVPQKEDEKEQNLFRGSNKSINEEDQANTSKSNIKMSVIRGINRTTQNTIIDMKSGFEHFQDGEGGKWYTDEPKDKFRFQCKKFMAFAGPGLLMSIAYLDPGNIEGDMDAGNYGQYKLIWALWWSTCLGLYYQILSAKIGVCTQRNLARVCADQYSTLTRYVLWIMTEIAIIGSDIQEVIGSASAIKILTGAPLYVGALVTILDSFLFLFIHYYGVRKLEFFFLTLIALMTVMFGLNMFYSQPNYGEMAYGLVVPTVPQGAWPATLGLIGAVIMPHNLYLHSSLVLTRKINYRNRTQVNEANIYNAMESSVALFVSFIISTFVISTFSVYIQKYPDADKDSINLYKAADVLAESLGDYAKYIWAVGLLAAGQSSTMTGTYAGQFVMEGFLDFTLPVWKRVLLTRSVAIIPALGVAFFNSDKLNQLDSGLNILQSIQLPFALVPLIKFASSPNIMKEFAIPMWQTIPASVFGVFLFFMNFVILFQGAELEVWQYVLVGIVALLYIILIIKACLEPTIPLRPITAKELEDHEYQQVEIESLENSEYVDKPQN